MILQSGIPGKEQLQLKPSSSTMHEQSGVLFGEGIVELGVLLAVITDQVTMMNLNREQEASNEHLDNH